MKDGKIDHTKAKLHNPVRMTQAHARSRCASIGSPAAPLPLTSSRAAGSDAAALRTIARTALLWRFSSKHATQGVALCSRARPQPEAENEQRRHRMLRRLGVRAASIPKPAAPCESRSHLSFNQAISRQGLGCTDTFGAPSAALRLAARSSHRGPAMGRNTAA